MDETTNERAAPRWRGLGRGLAAAGLAVWAAQAAPASAAVIYDSTPNPLPNNVVSIGYQCCQIAEFGDYIRFAGTLRLLTTVTLTLSNWAYASAYPGFGDATGFDQNLTLNLYNVVNGVTPSAGSLIATKTITAHILWRPEPSGSCTGGNYLGSDSACHGGMAENVTFDMSDLDINLPDDVIYGLAFNTQTYGASPTGVSGPYNSLNFGLTQSGPTVGTDVDPDAVFLNTSNPNNLTTGTPNVFGPDSGWPYTPTIQFSAVPEPATLALLGGAVFGLAAIRRRR